MWRSTSAFDHPGLAQIEKGIDSLTPGSADSHQMNILTTTTYFSKNFELASLALLFIIQSYIFTTRLFRTPLFDLKKISDLLF